jgi:membrane-associated phospholipid phosphatase
MLENIRQALLGADIAVFRFINTNLYNKTAAALIGFLGNDIVVATVVLGGFVLLAEKGRKNIKINTAFSLWALIAANLTSTFLLKPFFKRLRPYVALPDVNLLVEMKRYGWAFPSTHAAMAAALVTVLWGEYRDLRWIMALFVLFMCFFCVYTGAHYPADVAAGLILGIIIGMIFNYIKNKMINKK